MNRISITPVGLVAVLLYLPIALRRSREPGGWRFSTVRQAVEAYAAAAPLAINSWLVVSMAALALGLVVYVLALIWAYAGMHGALENATPTEVTFLESTSPGESCAVSPDKPTQTAIWYGAAFGITDTNVLLNLSAALCERKGDTVVQVSKLPALTVVEKLMRNDKQCAGSAHCSTVCSEYWRGRLIRLLGGSPRSGANELAREPQPPSRVSSPRDDGKKTSGCEIPDPSAWWSIDGLILKPSPISAPEVAQWLLGTQNCVGDAKEGCLLVTRLMQSALDNPAVRWERTIVNMLWGGERLAVLVLFFVLLLALSLRSLARQNLDLQCLELSKWYQHRLSLRTRPTTTPASAKAWLQQYELAGQWFASRFPEQEDNPLFSPIRNLLKVPERDEIELRARMDGEIITQSRVTFDALITVFPVIGFVATLWGLILALASANLIASSTGDERNAAVMRVTSELSSCFSTTLLALVFMTFFAIWNIQQAKREQALVGDTQDCLLSGGGNAARFLKESDAGQAASAAQAAEPKRKADAVP